MLTFLPGPIRGGISVLLVSINTILWTFPLLLLHFLKVLRTEAGWRRFWSKAQSWIGFTWISFNNGTFRIANPVKWDIQGVEGLNPNRWYLVIANHRSWVDILVLQRVFNGRIPFLKFFLKKELFWVPFLGLCWWALDFPFLERSARVDKDMDAIRRAAEKFKTLPVSVMNFVEGTRYTREKHEKTRSPYDHLLKPKPGGMTFLLASMAEEIHAVLDVTIAYPGGTPTMWGFLCGEAEVIRVRINPIPLTDELVGDYGNDKSFRRRFISWQKELWARKDEELGGLLK